MCSEGKLSLIHLDFHPEILIFDAEILRTIGSQEEEEKRTISLRESSSGFQRLLVVLLLARGARQNPRRTPVSLRTIRHGGQAKGKAGTEGKSSTSTRDDSTRVLRAPRREFHRGIHRFNGSTVATRCVWTAL